MNQMERFAIRVTAKSLKRRETFFKISSVIFLVAVVLLAISYSLASFASKAGAFTVAIPGDFTGKMIALSDTPGFESPVTNLKADVLEEMDNITESWLPENLTETDGAHNGEDYIGYTFYMKNMEDSAIDYQVEISILSVKKEADEAVRVMVIKNGEKSVYAKAKKDTGQPEEGTIPFFSETKVISELVEALPAAAVDQYTVVIWLEGNDPECVDEIRGGSVKMVMNFKSL